jgi:ABC-2 type transport system permease protein
MTERAMDDAGMNAGASAMFVQDAPGVAPAALHPTQSFYWSVRRELWEHRSIYLAPLAVAGLLVFGILIAAFGHWMKGPGFSNITVEQQRQVVGAPFDIAAFAVMGAGFLVAVLYCLDALYGERRDRSILFWKSLPVSDTTAVLSKMMIPLVVIPLVCFVVTISTQAVMSVIIAAGLAAHGIHLAVPVTQLPLVQMSVMLAFHLFAIHGLWYAPWYAWLLLVSAWARRAPFLWAVLPPLGVCLVEKLAFGTDYFARLLQHRFNGGGVGDNFTMQNVTMHGMSQMGVGDYLSAPGLWIGLLVAAAMLAGAVQMRRYRGPM